MTDPAREAEKVDLCPFCDSPNCDVIPRGRRCFVVNCDNCSAEGPMENTEAEAIAAWNRRSTFPGEGRGFDDGIEAAAVLFDKEAAKWREIADMPETENRTDSLSRISCLGSALAADERARRVRALKGTRT